MGLLNYSGSEVDIKISNRTANDLAFRITTKAGTPISQAGYSFKLTVRKDNVRATEAVLTLDGEVGTGGNSNRLSFPYEVLDVANLKAGNYFYTILKSNEDGVNTFMFGKFIVNENLS